MISKYKNLSELKIFTAETVKEIDKFTINNEPISSINLMERASKTIFNYIARKFDVNKHKFVFYCGPGNNGGDGLAVARMLLDKGAKITVYILSDYNKLSPDSKTNYNRLKEKQSDSIYFPSNISEIKKHDADDIIIDAIFGSGINSSVGGFYGEIIDLINISDNTTISIDIPSGLFGEDNTENEGKIVKADICISLEFPFLSLLFPENSIYCKELVVLPIGLHTKAKELNNTDYYLTSDSLIKNYLISRERFSHKGNYGHALLIAGSYGKAGAAILAARACLRSGVGLLTVHTPSLIYDSLQTSVPEAMFSIDDSKKIFTGISNIDNFSAIGFGPGLGTDMETEVGLIEMIKSAKSNLVIDADGLNILSKTNNFAELLPKNTILTPHPKEFERLFGKQKNTYSVIKKMQNISKKYKLIIVYKAGVSIISLPSGMLFFNLFGNPGMATAGSGDVLTGVILSLLSQGYEPELAAIIGTYIHSKSGDWAKQKFGEEALIASDIIDSIHKTF